METNNVVSNAAREREEVKNVGKPASVSKPPAKPKGKVVGGKKRVSKSKSKK